MRMEEVSRLSASLPVSPPAAAVATSATAKKRVEFFLETKRKKEDSIVRLRAKVMVIPFRHLILKDILIR
jgi:hypothetical protein